VNSTSRQGEGGAPNAISPQLLCYLAFFCGHQTCFFAVQQSKIMQFQQVFNHKERKEHRDNNLWCFFFAIFVFFAVNLFLVAACRAGIFAHFRTNSIETPVHQPLTGKTGPFPFKLNQVKSR
jgi:hypothetical protein